MTPFTWRDPLAAHTVAPELSDEERATVERFGIHDPSAEITLGMHYGGPAYDDCYEDTYGDPGPEDYDKWVDRNLEAGQASSGLVVYLFVTVVVFLLAVSVLWGTR